MQHADIYQKEFSPTGLEDYLYCPRKFFFRKLLRVGVRDKQLTLAFGSVLHAGVAEFSRLHVPDCKFSEVKLSVLKCLGETWKQEVPRGLQDSSRSLPVALNLMNLYMENYSSDTLSYSHIEAAQKIEMPNGTFLLGVVDRIHSSKTYNMVIDTKHTKAKLSDWFWKNFDNSFQLSCYYYMVEQICGNCDAIQVDAISLAEPHFDRRSWPLSAQQQAEFLNTYCKITDRILSVLSDTPNPNDFECHPTACGAYGGCPYIDLCKYGFDHPSVEEKFIIGDGEND